MKKLRLIFITLLFFILCRVSVYAFSCGEHVGVSLISMKGIKISTDYPAENAIDGESSTYTWNPGAQFSNNYIYEVDFGEETIFSRVAISFSTTPYSSKHQSQGVPPVWYIKTSNDRISWETQKKIYSYYRYDQVIDFPSVSARYVRIVPGERWMAIAELDILNVDNGLVAPSEDLSDTGLNLRFLTVPGTMYDSSPANAVYPAFVDNMPYEAFTEDERTEYYQIKVTGGQKPYRFRLTGGSLPTGLSLSTDGKISGTATVEGTFSFKVKVTDAKGRTATSNLNMVVKPYRGKWFSDARFGAFIQWGAFSTPNVLNTSAEQIAQWEQLYRDTWDAEQWASELKRLGVRVLNYTAVAGDAVRIWPSTTASKTNYYMKRNMAQELIDACHKYDIKIIFYIAGDYSWTSNNGCDPDTGSRSVFTMNCARELLNMGADGLWFDSGIVEGLYNFEDLVLMMRTVNPDATLQVNATTGGRGYIATPDVDITNFEGKAFVGANELSVGFLPAVKKKMATEVTSLLGDTWGSAYDESGNLLTLKSPQDMILNIQKNWDNGVTYMLVFSPGEDGVLLSDERVAERVEEICSWVRDNIEASGMPSSNLNNKAIYSESVELILTASEDADIYYTTDGTVPDNNSTLYTGPLNIDKTTHIMAVAYETGKGKSEILDETYVFDFYDKNSLLTENIYTSQQELQTPIDIYSGMIFTVKKNPIVLERIGKMGSSGDHRVQIIEVTRDFKRVFFETVTFTEAENGFSYADISPVILEAGSQYRILCDEAAGNTYYKLGDNLFYTDDIRIDSGAWTDSSLTTYYTKGTEDYSQFFDLEFRFYERSKNKNIAIGAKTELQYNSGSKASNSSNLEYASRAVDGRYDTYSAANAYAWTLWLDLGKKYDISKINVYQRPDSYSTSYEIYASNNNSRWTKIASGSCDETDTTISVTLTNSIWSSSEYRYIRVRSLKPDAAGQVGAQMFIGEVEVYERENTNVFFVDNVEQDGDDILTTVNIPKNNSGTMIVSAYAKDGRFLGASEQTVSTGNSAAKYDAAIYNIQGKPACIKMLLVDSISTLAPKREFILYEF